MLAPNQLTTEVRVYGHSYRYYIRYHLSDLLHREDKEYERINIDGAELRCGSN